jgi:outer membrane protein OmpA-like peptidoglycan-associated protein
MIKKNIFYVVLIAMTLGFSTPSFGIETKYESGYTMEKSQVNTNKKEDGVSLLTDSFAYSTPDKIFCGQFKTLLDFDSTIIKKDWSIWNIEGQFTQTSKGSIIFSHEGKLYIAKITENNQWGKPEKLKIKGMGKRRVTMRGSSLFYRSWRYPEEDAIVMYNPHLSKNGKRLFYASNYYGTKGNLDIWYSDMIEDNENEWNEPINLGDSINSASNENYPFIHDEFLYYSSDKKDSLKGSNIYKHNFSSQQSRLLAEPFNSDGDDYNMVGDGKYLFLVSNRDGNPDIYYPEQIIIAAADSIDADSLGDNSEKNNNLLANNNDNALNNNGDNQSNIDSNHAKNIEFPNINVCILYFIFDQDNFIADYKKEIEMIMNFIDYHKGANFKITGHTDTRGSIEYNQKLSERRAQKLKSILINKGVDENRLNTVGRSELELAIPNARNEKEHQLNRRVIIEKIEK